MKELTLEQAVFEMDKGGEVIVEDRFNSRFIANRTSMFSLNTIMNARFYLYE